MTDYIWRPMSHRRPRPSGAEFALLVLLAAWALFPLVIFLIRAAQLHGVYTGADGLIGADGVLGVDQLQYLAWARDAAHHGLVSDLFTLEPNGHVYLQPVFLLVGLLHRLGLSLPLGLPADQAVRRPCSVRSRGRCGAGASYTEWRHGPRRSR